MQLLVIRHAIAEDRGEFAATGAPDEERPLTPFGKRRMRRNIDGLRRIAPRINVLASSPLLRAQQTASMLAEAYHVDEVVSVEALRHDSLPRTLVPWLAKQDPESVVAVVGHEPHLGMLVTWLMSGLEESRTPLKKGGAALLDFVQKPGSGRAQLLWLVTPAQLRTIGD